MINKTPMLASPDNVTLVWEITTAGGETIIRRQNLTDHVNGLRIDDSTGTADSVEITLLRTEINSISPRPLV